MKKKTAIILAAMLVILLFTGCFGGNTETPTVEAGQEITLSGRAEEGDFKMTVSVKNYVDRAALEVYSKKMSLGEPSANGMVELSFRLDEYEGSDSLDVMDYFYVSFPDAKGGSDAWIVGDSFYDGMPNFSPIAEGENTAGWISMDGEAPTYVRLDFQNAAGLNVSADFLLPEAGEVPEPERTPLTLGAPAEAEEVQITASKIETADQVCPAPGDMMFAAPSGEKYIIADTILVNGSGEELGQTDINAFFEAENGEVYPCGGIYTHNMENGSLTVFEKIAAGEIKRIYFTASAPESTEGNGELVLIAGERSFSIPYTLNETQSSMEAREAGQAITADTWEYTIKSVERAEQMNPPATGGSYDYVTPNEAGMDFVIVKGTFQNNGTEELEAGKLLGIAAKYNGKYYLGEERTVKESGNGFETVAIVPGEQRDVYFMTAVPKDAVSADILAILNTINVGYSVMGIPD